MARSAQESLSLQASRVGGRRPDRGLRYSQSDSARTDSESAGPLPGEAGLLGADRRGRHALGGRALPVGRAPAALRRRRQVLGGVHFKRQRPERWRRLFPSLRLGRRRRPRKALQVSRAGDSGLVRVPRSPSRLWGTSEIAGGELRRCRPSQATEADLQHLLFSRRQGRRSWSPFSSVLRGGPWRSRARLGQGRRPPQSGRILAIQRHFGL